MDRIFEEIGSKLATFAKVFLVLGCIGWVVLGFVWSYNVLTEERNIPILLGTIVGGWVVNYGVSLLLYGLGKIVDHLADIRRAIYESAPNFRYDKNSMLDCVLSMRQSGEKLVELSEELDEEE